MRLRALRVEADIRLALGSSQSIKPPRFWRNRPHGKAGALDEAAFFASTPGRRYRTRSARPRSSIPEGCPPAEGRGVQTEGFPRLHREKRKRPDCAPPVEYWIAG